jgi:endonuclease YncB( thermonuclease family)
MYEYRARVLEDKDVYDGDTVSRMEVELGFNASMKKMKFRLFGINTPELRGGTDETKALARASRDRLRELIVGKEIQIKTFKGSDYVDKKGKYGRWLCIIYLLNEDGSIDPVSVNDKLVIEGHAVAKDYG